MSTIDHEQLGGVTGGGWGTDFVRGAADLVDQMIPREPTGLSAPGLPKVSWNLPEKPVNQALDYVGFPQRSQEPSR
jgi:hypothetical protein